MRDTGTLFAALAPTFQNTPGALEEHMPFGVIVGYGGPHSHPEAPNLTIADLAAIHQLGLGNVPVREIIVSPPEHVINAMRGDLERALDKIKDG